MKTQLRFGARDIEILLKKKGAAEPYKKVPYKTITDPDLIPKFDYTLKWKPRNDRMTRRKLVVHSDYSKGKDVENKQSYKIQR